MRVFPLLVCVIAGTLLLAGPVQARSANTTGLSCHKINAKGVGQDLGPAGTVANINGAGLLNGTTAGSFAIVGGSPPVLTITGTVVFTTHHGTLTVAPTGSFNVATGAFSATGPVVGATGKLAGATGSLTLTGVENLTTGMFTESISGRICVDLSP